MFPSALILFNLDKGTRFRFSNPGHVFDFRIIDGSDGQRTIKLFARNNILSHLIYFTVLSFENRRGMFDITGIPHLNYNQGNNLHHAMLFLPSPI